MQSADILNDDEVQKLCRILEMLEEAQSWQEAVWFGPEGREEISEIRHQLEEHT